MADACSRPAGFRDFLLASDGVTELIDKLKPLKVRNLNLPQQADRHRAQGGLLPGLFQEEDAQNTRGPDQSRQPHHAAYCLKLFWSSPLPQKTSHNEVLEERFLRTSVNRWQALDNVVLPQARIANTMRT